MKKILIAKENLEKTYSGATRTVYEQIRYFHSLGHEVHVVGEKLNSKDLKASGATTHKTMRWPWQKKVKRRMQFSDQALKVARNINADLVIGHGDLQQQDVFLLHNCIHLASEKIHKRALSTNNEMYNIHTPILKNKQFKHLIANSQLMKDDLIKRFGIDESYISVVYPSLDPKQFRLLAQEQRDEVRTKLNIKEDEYLVGLITSGNFKKRGVDRFFTAINLLPKEVANKTHFIFVGKDKLDSETQNILDCSPYQSRIKFMPIVDNVEEYFNALDIFVLPARIEEFGRVVAEAMCCGAPVITTKWVGASELMQDESREFIYDGESCEELAKLMIKLLTDQNLRNKLKKLNHLSAQEITEEKIYEKFSAIFN